jgi:2-oxoglutarate ferredoxin oxidoreductase subunit delta
MAIVKIREDKCKSCRLCINFCPSGALKLSTKINKKGFHPVEVVKEGKCTGCGICVLVCPDSAIEVYEESDINSKIKTQKSKSI